MCDLLFCKDRQGSLFFTGRAGENLCGAGQGRKCVVKHFKGNDQIHHWLITHSNVNFKIIETDSDSSSGKAHFSYELFLHWIFHRFALKIPCGFHSFHGAGLVRTTCCFCWAGSPTLLLACSHFCNLDLLQSPLQATHISFICPMSFDKFPLDEQVLSRWCGWWWWWSLISTLNWAQGGF